MSFLAPLAFAFAATIPVVIVFYLLKRRRVVKLISSTLLWQRFLAETQANAPFQRLRHNWLLILQLLLLVLLVLALTRPYLAGEEKTMRLLVVILDASASMQSTDVSPSRFEKARSEALKWVDALRDYDQMIVLQAAANTEVKQSPTSDKAALRRALQGCAVTDSPTRLAEALKLAETLIRSQTGAEIHLFSDGVIPNLEDFENRNLPLTFHRVGERGDNLGIVAIDVRANPDNPLQRAVFASVASFSTNAMSADLELWFENQLLETRPLSLQATNVSPQVFLASQDRDGVFSVRLKVNDLLVADNQASILSLLPRPVKVLLVTQGNRFLERALRAVASVQLTVVTDSADGASTYDLVVLDNLLPTTWPSANLLAIHTAPTNWFDGLSRIEEPVIVDWKNAHPLLRSVNFDNVQVAEAMAVKTPAWATSLVDSPQAPLLLAGERDRRRIVWVAFDTIQSTWPLRISFPIFIANAVDWLNPASASAAQQTVRAGDPIRLALPQPANEAQVTLPDGSAKTLQLDAGARELVYGDTAHQGVYRVQVGTNTAVYCVNLLDAGESNIKPREELPLGRYARTTASKATRSNKEWWRYLAAAGLFVLLFEWWYYHRRTV